jgi:hypothetical protein
MLDDEKLIIKLGAAVVAANNMVTFPNVLQDCR